MILKRIRLDCYYYFFFDHIQITAILYLELFYPEPLVQIEYIFHARKNILIFAAFIILYSLEIF